MSHDLLVQMAHRKYFLQSFHHGCLLLNKREQVTHYGTTNQKFANACGRRNKQKGVLDLLFKLYALTTWLRLSSTS